MPLESLLQQNGLWEQHNQAQQQMNYKRVSYLFTYALNYEKERERGHTRTNKTT
jgi:hypothetical protein